MHSYLINFHREFKEGSYQDPSSFSASQFQSRPDLAERIGQWGMGWLSLGFGKTIKVTSINSDRSSEAAFEKEVIPTWRRICAAVSAILLFPISLLLAGIGCIGLACSDSLANVHLDYQRYRDQKAQEAQEVKDAQKEAQEAKDAQEAQKNTLPEDKFLEDSLRIGSSPSLPNLPHNEDKQLKNASHIIAPDPHPQLEKTTTKETAEKTITKEIKEGKKHTLPDNIPPECDIRGTKWLNSTHILTYAQDYLKKNNSKVEFYNINSPSSIIQDIHVSFLQNLPFSERFYLMTVPPDNNHWTLVYIRPEDKYKQRTQRTIEYFDSKVNYGDYPQMIAGLEELGHQLDQDYPGEPGKTYQVVPKVQEILQPNGYDCGLWVLYFIMLLTENPDIDLNELDVDQLQGKIDELRLNVMLRLIELCEENPSLSDGLRLAHVADLNWLQQLHNGHNRQLQ